MIRVQALVKKFGDFTAVDNISFEVPKGEIFAFLGPNGAGKTTTIKILTTLLKATSGTVEVDGRNPTTHENEVRQSFGIVFQDPSLDQDLTAWENMDLHGVLYHVPGKVRRERAETLLKLFELWERKDALVKTFSGGMRRRLEIARGFLHTPKILFLDEPTLGLDPQSRNQLWTHVRRQNEADHVTVFLTTHYMDEAERVADRIAVIDRGKWRRCFAGEAVDERDLYFVAARSKKVLPVESTDYRIARPATFVFAGAGFRAWARVSESRRRELLAIYGAGNCRNGGAVHLGVFRHCAPVGPAVWIFERDASGAGAADLRDDRADAGRRDGSDAARHADRGGVPDCGIPPGEFHRDTAGICVYGVDRDRVCGVGDVHRFEFAGHAGIPADHEFSGVADFLFVGSAVSAEQFAEGAVVGDETRSALVWSGWIARCAHRRVALWRDCGCRGACGRRRGAAWSRRMALLEDRDLADGSRIERTRPQQSAGVRDGAF